MVMYESEIIKHKGFEDITPERFKREVCSICKDCNKGNTTIEQIKSCIKEWD